MVQLTPIDDGKANLSIEALGLNESETLSITKNDIGVLSKNRQSVELDLTAGVRFQMKVSLLENYRGPIEIKLTRAESGDSR